MRKFTEAINNEQYSELIEDLKEKIENTINSSGGNFEDFVKSYTTSPDDYQIEGLINDSDLYDWYMSFRNDIDEILTDIKFFTETPSESNVVSLYDYTISGVKRVIEELIKDL